MSSVNIIADEVDMERKIRLLEIREKMGDKRAFWELRKLRQSIKSNHNSRANQQIRSNPRPQSQQKQKILQVPRRNPKTTSGHISNYITVEASGVGADHDSALRDAFKDAVRKVVGVYVITQSKMASSSQADDLFDEKIHLNADAVVTDHKLLQKTENDGVISIKIKATVVKNDLLKYIKPKESNEVTDTDIANLLNKLDAISEAEKSLEYILKDYPNQVISIRKKGNFSLGSNKNTPQGFINFQIDYEIAFNDKGFQVVRRRLQELLDKIAYGRIAGRKTDHNSSPGFYDFLADFVKKHPRNIEYICFIDHHRNNPQVVDYKIYAVHKKIYDKISDLTYVSGVVFQFFLKNSQEPIIRALPANMPFIAIQRLRNYRYYNGHFPIRVFNVGVLKREFKKGFFMRKEDFKNLRKIKIKAAPNVDWNNLQSLPEEKTLEIFGKKFSQDKFHWTGGIISF